MVGKVEPASTPDQHVDCVTVVHVDACPERSFRTHTCARRMHTAKIWKRN